MTDPTSTDDACGRAIETYWQSAPDRYRCRYERTHERVAPLDPFKIEFVDPDRIEHFTGRTHPPWENRKALFGSVLDGDWDRPPRTTTHDEAPFYLIGDGEGATFEDTINYRALAHRFGDGGAWEDTELVRTIFEHIDAGDGSETYWHGCATKEAVLDRCAFLDDVFADMRENGFKTQMELVYEDPTAHRGFLDAVAYEVAVDIGRKGQLLVVTGRHRLSMAKILDLDALPVAFYVRHPEWMDVRDRYAAGEDTQQHPDLVEVDDSAPDPHLYTRLATQLR